MIYPGEISYYLSKKQVITSNTSDKLRHSKRNCVTEIKPAGQRYTWKSSDKDEYTEMTEGWEGV